MKRIFSIMFYLLLGLSVHAQLIDNYGLRIGAGFSNQNWAYKSSNSNSSQPNWREYKSGFLGQFFIEKRKNNNFAFRSGIGYLQKGFTDKVSLTSNTGTENEMVDMKVILHDLSLDLSMKIIFSQKKLKPYLQLGFRGTYMLDFKSTVINLDGEEQEVYNYIYEDFNRFTFGGILGFGITYGELLFMDIEFNPSFTKSYSEDWVDIKDRYFSLTIGLNINQLIKDKSE